MSEGKNGPSRFIADFLTELTKSSIMGRFASILTKVDFNSKSYQFKVQPRVKVFGMFLEMVSPKNHASGPALDCGIVFIFRRSPEQVAQTTSGTMNRRFMGSW